MCTYVQWWCRFGSKIILCWRFLRVTTTLQKCVCVCVWRYWKSPQSMIRRGLKHQALGLITVGISKARAPIKSERALYWLLGCHSKEIRTHPPWKSATPVFSPSQDSASKWISDEHTASAKCLERSNRGGTESTHLCVPCVCVFM